jgi:rhamnulokinase
MGMWLEQECRRIWREENKNYSFAEIKEMVMNSPVNGPVIDTRDLRFMLPDNMIEEIQSACKESNQKVPQTEGEILRCVYESLAAAYKQTLDEIISVSGRKIEKLHIVGGGSQNEMLNQMTADLCGITVETGPIEGTAIGNLLVQLIANGELKDMDEARQLVKASFPTTIYQPKKN